MARSKKSEVRRLKARLVDLEKEGRAIRKAMRGVEQDLAALLTPYPIGSMVSWKHGDTQRRVGRVERVLLSYGDDVRPLVRQRKKNGEFSDKLVELWPGYQDVKPYEE